MRMVLPRATNPPLNCRARLVGARFQEDRLSSPSPTTWTALPAAPAVPIYAPLAPVVLPRAAARSGTAPSAANEAALATEPSAVKSAGTVAGRASLLIAGLALGIAMLVLVRQFPRDRLTASAPAAREAAADPGRPTPPTQGGKPDPTAKEAVKQNPAATNGSMVRPPADIVPIVPDPPPPPPPVAAERMRDALWLVTVEEPRTHTSWPVAVAAAVRKRAALTSATVVGELRRFQSESWKLWLMRPGSRRRLSIIDFRQHLGFASAVGEPTTQIYDDFGLLTIDGDLDQLLGVATGEERAAIEQGMPLTCLTIAFEWEPVTKYQSYEPITLKGKVRAVTVLRPGQRGSPRLIHGAFEMPSKAYGSPLLNSSRRLIGVYAETVPRTAAGADVQYVPVFDGRWLDDEQGWVPPSLPDAAQQQPDAAPTR